MECVSYAQINKENFTAAQRIQLELKAEQFCLMSKGEEVCESLPIRLESSRKDLDHLKG